MYFFKSSYDDGDTFSQHTAPQREDWDRKKGVSKKIQPDKT